MGVAPPLVVELLTRAIPLTGFVQSTGSGEEPPIFSRRPPPQISRTEWRPTVTESDTGGKQIHAKEKDSGDSGEQVAPRGDQPTS